MTPPKKGKRVSALASRYLAAVECSQMGIDVTTTTAVSVKQDSPPRAKIWRRPHSSSSLQELRNRPALAASGSESLGSTKTPPNSTSKTVNTATTSATTPEQNLSRGTSPASSRRGTPVRDRSSGYAFKRTTRSLFPATSPDERQRTTHVVVPKDLFPTCGEETDGSSLTKEEEEEPLEADDEGYPSSIESNNSSRPSTPELMVERDDMNYHMMQQHNVGMRNNQRFGASNRPWTRRIEGATKMATASDTSWIKKKSSTTRNTSNESTPTRPQVSVLTSRALQDRAARQSPTNTTATTTSEQHELHSSFGAPTEVMSNQTGRKLSSSPDHMTTVSGAQTEIITNRARDLLNVIDRKRRQEEQHEEDEQQQQQQEPLLQVPQHEEDEHDVNDNNDNQYAPGGHLMMSRRPQHQWCADESIASSGRASVGTWNRATATSAMVGDERIMSPKNLRSRQSSSPPPVTIHAKKKKKRKGLLPPCSDMSSIRTATSSLDGSEVRRVFSPVSHDSSSHLLPIGRLGHHVGGGRQLVSPVLRASDGSFQDRSITSSVGVETGWTVGNVFQNKEEQGGRRTNRVNEEDNIPSDEQPSVEQRSDELPSDEAMDETPFRSENVIEPPGTDPMSDPANPSARRAAQTLPLFPDISRPGFPAKPSSNASSSNNPFVVRSVGKGVSYGDNINRFKVVSPQPSGSSGWTPASFSSSGIESELLFLTATKRENKSPLKPRFSHGRIGSPYQTGPDADRNSPREVNDRPDPADTSQTSARASERNAARGADNNVGGAPYQPLSHGDSRRRALIRKGLWPPNRKGVNSSRVGHSSVRGPDRDSDKGPAQGAEMDRTSPCRGARPPSSTMPIAVAASGSMNNARENMSGPPERGQGPVLRNSGTDSRRTAYGLRPVSTAVAANIAPVESFEKRNNKYDVGSLDKPESRRTTPYSNREPDDGRKVAEDNKPSAMSFRHRNVISSSRDPAVILSMKDRIRALNHDRRSRDEDFSRTEGAVPVQTSQTSFAGSNMNRPIRPFREESRGAKDRHPLTSDAAGTPRGSNVYLRTHVPPTVVSKVKPRHEYADDAELDDDIKDHDSLSVDVQSIRSVFESSTNDGSGSPDDDDQSLDVASIRSMFEGDGEDSAESGEVQKMRSMFESQQAPITNFAGNSTLKSTWAKFESRSRPSSKISSGRLAPKSSSPVATSQKGTKLPAGRTESFVNDNSIRLDRRHRGDETRASQEQPQIQSSNEDGNCDRDERIISVAERVRAFGRGEHLRGNVSNFHERNSSETPQHELTLPSLSPHKEDEVARHKARHSGHNHVPGARDVAIDYTSLKGRLQALSSSLEPENESSRSLGIKASQSNLEMQHNPASQNVPGIEGNSPESSCPSDSRSEKEELDVAEPGFIGIRPRTAADECMMFPVNAERPKGMPDSQDQDARISKTQPGSSQMMTQSQQPNRESTAADTGDSARRYTMSDHNSLSPVPPAENGRSSIDGASRTDSEFDDGVTLDLSIEEISGLTNPTCLQSKEGVNSNASEASSDRTSRDESSQFTDRPAPSEASSSQTSEAAAPLIALMKRSDDSTSLGVLTGKSSQKTTPVSNEKENARSSSEKKCETVVDDSAWNIGAFEANFADFDAAPSSNWQQFQSSNWGSTRSSGVDDFFSNMWGDAGANVADIQSENNKAASQSSKSRGPPKLTGPPNDTARTGNRGANDSKSRGSPKLTGPPNDTGRTGTARAASDRRTRGRSPVRQGQRPPRAGRAFPHTHPRTNQRLAKKEVVPHTRIASVAKPVKAAPRPTEQHQKTTGASSSIKASLKMQALHHERREVGRTTKPMPTQGREHSAAGPTANTSLSFTKHATLMARLRSLKESRIRRNAAKFSRSAVLSDRNKVEGGPRPRDRLAIATNRLLGTQSPPVTPFLHQNSVGHQRMKHNDRNASGRNARSVDIRHEPSGYAVVERVIDDEYSASTMSSTRFGGNKFEQCLDLD